MIKFSKRLKEIREESGLSQSKLAKELGFSQSTITKWETGERSPNLEVLVQIAKYFKASTDYLLGIED